MGSEGGVEGLATLVAEDGARRDGLGAVGALCAEMTAAAPAEAGDVTVFGLAVEAVHGGKYSMPEG